MRLKNNAILIGRVAGIPIRLHISLPIVVLIFAAMAGRNFLEVIVFALGLFGSVALHELGHSLVAQKKGSYIHEIVLYPFGGAAKIVNIPKKPIDEIWVALAGPGVSLVLALIFFGHRYRCYKRFVADQFDAVRVQCAPGFSDGRWARTARCTLYEKKSSSGDPHRSGGGKIFLPDFCDLRHTQT